MGNFSNKVVASASVVVESMHKAIEEGVGKVPYTKREGNWTYHLDKDYILHISFYGQEVIVADFKRKVVTNVLSGEQPTVSTIKGIRRVLNELESIGYQVPEKYKKGDVMKRSAVYRKLSSVYRPLLARNDLMTMKSYFERFLKQLQNVSSDVSNVAQLAFNKIVRMFNPDTVQKQELIDWINQKGYRIRPSLANRKLLKGNRVSSVAERVDVLDNVRPVDITIDNKKTLKKKEREVSGPPYLVVRYKCPECGRLFEMDYSINSKVGKEECSVCGVTADEVFRYIESSRKIKSGQNKVFVQKGVFERKKEKEKVSYEDSFVSSKKSSRSVLSGKEIHQLKKDRGLKEHCKRWSFEKQGREMETGGLRDNTDKINEIKKGIIDGTDKYFGYSHFHISNMSDYTLMSETIKDMVAIYGINEVDAVEIIEDLTHGEEVGEEEFIPSPEMAKFLQQEIE